MNAKFELLTENRLNELRGKAMVGHISQDEMMSVFNHLTVLETKLDEADYEDMLGTEGWRHFVGMPE